MPPIEVNYVNFKMRTALHKAAFNGHHQIVLLLLENGADPRLSDEALMIPLDYAANSKTRTLLRLWDIKRTIKFWEDQEPNKKDKFKLFYEYLDLDPKKL
jgi:hypothetical protein